MHLHNSETVELLLKATVEHLLKATVKHINAYIYGTTCMMSRC